MSSDSRIAVRLLNVENCWRELPKGRFAVVRAPCAYVTIISDMAGPREIGLVTQDQKRKQEIKGQRRYNAHIDSGDRLSVIFQKSLPSLRRRILTTHHVFLYGPAVRCKPDVTIWR